MNSLAPSETSGHWLPLALALAFSSLLVSALALLAHASPLAVWHHLLVEPWTSVYGIGQALAKATPLLLLGTAAWLARVVGLVNLAVLAQLALASFVYALVAAWLGPIALPWPLTWLGVLVPTLAAIATGALLGAALGWLRAYRDGNEIVASIACNAIVLAAIVGLGRRFAFVGEAPRTVDIPGSSTLPTLGLDHSQASAALLVALAVVAATAWAVRHTRVGLMAQMIGANPTAAAHAGVPVAPLMVATLALSGAIAGLGALHTVAGYKHAYELGLEGSSWFVAVALAMLAERRLPWLVGLSLLVGTLQHGGLLASQMLPREVTDTMIAVMMLAMAGAHGVWHRRSVAP